MLNCEYCDYYRKLQKASDAHAKSESLCDFTGLIFTEDVGELNIEPPCSCVSYQDYLERKKKTRAVSDTNDDWKLQYTKHHVKPAARKEKIIA